MVVGHPLEQRLDLVCFAAGAGRRWATRDLLGYFDRALAHRAPIRNCGLHVAERALDLRFQLAQPLLVADAVNLDVLPRFGRDPVCAGARKKLQQVAATVANARVGDNHPTFQKATRLCLWRAG